MLYIIYILVLCLQLLMLFNFVKITVLYFVKS